MVGLGLNAIDDVDNIYVYIYILQVLVKDVYMRTLFITIYFICTSATGARVQI